MDNKIFIENSNNQESLEGINGWLLLPAIGLILGALASLGSFINAPTLFEKVWMGGILLFIVINSLCFFYKKKITPLLMIISCILQIIFSIIVFYFVNKNTQGAIQMFFYTTSSIIWISYFSISKRVKNTFIK